MFQNIPQVTKNILILNILFFVASFIFMGKQMDLVQLLGTHYVNSPLFQPYQVITHFFMHANFFHIFMNMWLFVMLGGFLERLWGPKRFFIFYIVSALAAFALHNAIGVYEIMQLKSQLVAQGFDIEMINNQIKENLIMTDVYENGGIYREYIDKCFTPMVGASGAVFGVMAAFAILFPNTEFLLYFAIPVKAKYLVGVYLIFEVYMAFENRGDDPVAHLAHIGGALAGGIMVLLWRKRDRSNFW